jgi:hypothetical protein
MVEYKCNDFNGLNGCPGCPIVLLPSLVLGVGGVEKVGQLTINQLKSLGKRLSKTDWTTVDNRVNRRPDRSLYL